MNYALFPKTKNNKIHCLHASYVLTFYILDILIRMMEYSDKVIELTEKDVFSIFADVDRNSGSFKANKKEDYLTYINSKLPSSCVLPLGNEIINVLIRKYRRKKLERISLAKIIEMAENTVVLSLLVPHNDEGSPILKDNESGNETVVTLAESEPESAELLAETVLS